MAVVPAAAASPAKRTLSVEHLGLTRTLNSAASDWILSAGNVRFRVSNLAFKSRSLRLARNKLEHLRYD